VVRNSVIKSVFVLVENDVINNIEADQAYRFNLSRRSPLILLEHSTKPFQANDFVRIHSHTMLLRNAST